MWSRAEAQFAQFIKRFPDSTNVPAGAAFAGAGGFQTAGVHQHDRLLTTNLPAAGGLADQYVYWIGEAQFQSGDIAQAAATFDSLVKKYPDSPLRLRAVV